MKKKIIIIFFTLATVGALTAGVVTVNAAGWKTGQNDMVAALAKKLGLSEDKVKNAFDAIQKDKQAEMQKLFLKN